MFIDNLLAYPYFDALARFAWLDPQFLHHELVSSVVIDITNVARYIWEDSSQEYWSLWEDFPNLAPPWPLIFFQWRPPRYSRSGDVIIRLEPEVHEYLGGLMRAMEIQTDEELTVTRAIFRGKLMNAQRFTLESRPKWLLWITYFAETKWGQIDWVGDEFLAVQADGLANYDYPIAMRFYESPDMRKVGVDPAKAVDSLRAAPLLTICFLHCKNVVVEGHKPPVKLQRARERRHKPHLRPYKTLDILPVQRMIERAQGVVSTEERKHIMRTAIVRGHFKDYTRSESGLFGKYKGMWWWNTHLRGGTRVEDAVKHINIRYDPEKMEEAMKLIHEIVERDPRLRKIRAMQVDRGTNRT